MAYMSQEGYDKLRAQIKQLEEVERPEVIRQIAEAYRNPPVTCKP